MVDLNQVKQAYANEVERLGKYMKNFPWEDKAAYANWCAQTYYYVCHSTRLLAVSASRIPLANDEHYTRFLRHLQEEKGHEKLALRDLEKLGHSTNEYPEEANTAAFYQTQYFYIERVNTFALFGYILLLEGLAATYGPECYRRVLAAHGKEAATFWKVHAEDDPAHVEQAFMVLQKLDGTALAAVLRNLRDTADRYGSLLETAARTATHRKAA